MFDIDDLKRKAEDGDAEAQNELGKCYQHGKNYQGKGSTIDTTEAFRWFLRSAKQQNPAATLNLAQCFSGNVYDDELPTYSDDEVDYNPMVEARKWAEIADFYNELHQSGYSRIRDYFFKLSSRMSDKQQAEGSRRAGEFLDKWGRGKD
ncbi:MAG: hypothetical protein OXU71_05375 [Gammaproteobacteria bacterium]|nr:hypothetical protein [Gammaproteobacteria bacterium]